MNKTTTLGFALAATVLGLVIAPLTQHGADAAMEDKMMDKMMKPVSIKGDLTAPSGDTPFGGDKAGSYQIKVKDSKVTVTAKLGKYMMRDSMEHDKMMDDKMSDKMAKESVLEGWLVDMQTGYKLSLGLLKDGKLAFTQRMVNPFIYDLVVITEEPTHDTDPNPHKPVAGVQISEPFGQ